MVWDRRSELHLGVTGNETGIVNTLGVGRDGDRRVGVIERDPFFENQRVGLQVVIQLGFFVFLEHGQLFAPTKTD